MTMINYGGILLLFVIIAVGTFVKIRIGRKVKSLEGVVGTVREKKGSKKKKIIGELGE